MSATVEGYGINGIVTTLDATMTPLMSLTFEVERSGWLVARIICRRVADGVAKVWDFGLGFKRDSGDVVAFGVNLNHTKGVASDQAALVATDVTISATGNDVVVNVVGLAGTELDWAGTLSGEAVVHV